MCLIFVVEPTHKNILTTKISRITVDTVNKLKLDLCLLLSRFCYYQTLTPGAYLNPGPHGPGPYHQTVQIIIFIINCYYIHVCAHNKNQNLVYHRVHSAAVQLISPLNFSAKLLPQKQNHSVTLVRIATVLRYNNYRMWAWLTRRGQ